ncbi:MAG: hypothetical protein JXA21_19630 [Anaerolineae bacterium]|nr:hypothetical protein [Anaerolineae bacterium]
MTTERDYEAYLLRLWRVRREGKVAWRASVENAHTGERKGFTTLEALFDFLRRQTGASPDSDESMAGTERKTR